MAMKAVQARQLLCSKQLGEPKSNPVTPLDTHDLQVLPEVALQEADKSAAHAFASGDITGEGEELHLCEPRLQHTNKSVMERALRGCEIVLPPPTFLE